MSDTTRLKNAYKKFGNTMYVDHWFQAPTLIGTMRPVVENKTRDFYNKPKHWQHAIQLSHRRFERLSMSEKWDTVLVIRNDKYINFYPVSAIALERFARRKKRHDWRVEIIEAFESRIYQRQGTKKWLLIETGKGYA